MVVDQFDTSEIIEGRYKISKTLEAMKYQSNEVIHVAEEKYDKWPNRLVTSIKV
jgi:hypothetical protein